MLTTLALRRTTHKKVIIHFQLMAHWYEQVKTIPKTPVLTKKTILLRFGTYEKGDS